MLLMTDFRQLLIKKGPFDKLTTLQNLYIRKIDDYFHSLYQLILLKRLYESRLLPFKYADANIIRHKIHIICLIIC